FPRLISTAAKLPLLNEAPKRNADTHGAVEQILLSPHPPNDTQSPRRNLQKILPLQSSFAFPLSHPLLPSSPAGSFRKRQLDLPHLSLPLSLPNHLKGLPLFFLRLHQAWGSDEVLVSYRGSDFFMLPFIAGKTSDRGSFNSYQVAFLQTITPPQPNFWWEIV
ncbi:hypothetical protein SAY86_012945, partial [Trapa natans]